MIAIIDYGVGNLFSLKSSLKQLGLEAVVTADADTIRKADRRKADYYNYYTQNRWGEAASYDLCLNAAMGTETCARILLTAYKAIQEGLPK